MPVRMLPQSETKWPADLDPIKIKVDDRRKLSEIESSHQVGACVRWGTVHPSKRANWAKYCRKCGVDIRRAPRYVRLCSSCASEK
jgi:hypothetical protein